MLGRRLCQDSCFGSGPVGVGREIFLHWTNWVECFARALVEQTDLQMPAMCRVLTNLTVPEPQKLHSAAE